MKIVIISGSHRKKSQSFKISSWLSKALKSKDRDYEVDIINLGGNPFPLWDEDAWDSDSKLSAQMEPHLELLSAADALIIVSPEWHGMVPGGLKNFLLYVTSKHVAHKPCMLVGVSASKGGAYPIAELRSSGYKNNRMTYIPEHLIVRNCEDVMNDPTLDQGSEEDKYIKKRAHYTLDVLLAYAAALKTMRHSHTLMKEEYPNGM